MVKKEGGIVCDREWRRGDSPQRTDHHFGKVKDGLTAKETRKKPVRLKIQDE